MSEKRTSTSDLVNFDSHNIRNNMSNEVDLQTSDKYDKNWGKAKNIYNDIRENMKNTSKSTKWGKAKNIYNDISEKSVNFDSYNIQGNMSNTFILQTNSIQRRMTRLYAEVANLRTAMKPEVKVDDEEKPPIMNMVEYYEHKLVGLPNIKEVPRRYSMADALNDSINVVSDEFIEADTGDLYNNHLEGPDMSWLNVGSTDSEIKDVDDIMRVKEVKLIDIDPNDEKQNAEYEEEDMVQDVQVQEPKPPTPQKTSSKDWVKALESIQSKGIKGTKIQDTPAPEKSVNFDSYSIQENMSNNTDLQSNNMQENNMNTNTEPIVDGAIIYYEDETLAREYQQSLVVFTDDEEEPEVKVDADFRIHVPFLYPEDQHEDQHEEQPELTKRIVYNYMKEHLDDDLATVNKDLKYLYPSAELEAIKTTVSCIYNGRLEVHKRQLRKIREREINEEAEKCVEPTEDVKENHDETTGQDTEEITTLMNEMVTEVSNSLATEQCTNIINRIVDNVTAEQSHEKPDVFFDVLDSMIREVCEVKTPEPLELETETLKTETEIPLDIWIEVPAVLNPRSNRLCQPKGKVGKRLVQDGEPIITGYAKNGKGRISKNDKNWDLQCDDDATMIRLLRISGDILMYEPEESTTENDAEEEINNAENWDLECDDDATMIELLRISGDILMYEPDEPTTESGEHEINNRPEPDDSNGGEPDESNPEEPEDPSPEEAEESNNTTGDIGSTSEYTVDNPKPAVWEYKACGTGDNKNEEGKDEEKTPPVDNPVIVTQLATGHRTNNGLRYTVEKFEKATRSGLTVKTVKYMFTDTTIPMIQFGVWRRFTDILREISADQIPEFVSKKSSLFIHGVNELGGSQEDVPISEPFRMQSIDEHLSGMWLNKIHRNIDNYADLHIKGYSLRSVWEEEHMGRSLSIKSANKKWANITIKSETNCLYQSLIVARGYMNSRDLLTLNSQKVRVEKAQKLKARMLKKFPNLSKGYATRANVQAASTYLKVRIKTYDNSYKLVHEYTPISKNDKLVKRALSKTPIELRIYSGHCEPLINKKVLLRLYPDYIDGIAFEFERTVTPREYIEDNLEKCLLMNLKDDSDNVNKSKQKVMTQEKLDDWAKHEYYGGLFDPTNHHGECRYDAFDPVILQGLVDNMDELAIKYPTILKNDVINSILKLHKIAPEGLHEAIIIPGGRAKQLGKRLKKDVRKNRPEWHYGRLYNYRSVGLQNMSKIIRKLITGNMHAELDISNCHPNSINHFCIKNKINAPYIKLYCDNRESTLKDIMSETGVTRGRAKTAFLELINGGEKWKKVTPDSKYMKGMADEMKRLRSPIINEVLKMDGRKYEDELKIFKGDSEEILKRRIKAWIAGNLDGSKPRLKNTEFDFRKYMVSEYMSRIERQVVEYIKTYCIENHLVGEVFSVIHDGILMPKTKKLEKSVKKCEEYLCKMMGYRYVLGVKDYTSSINFGIKVNKLIDPETVESQCQKLKLSKVWIGRGTSNRLAEIHRPDNHDKHNIKLAAWDLETFADPEQDNKFIPYALIFAVKDGPAKDLTMRFRGLDCCEQFIEYLKTNVETLKGYTLYAHNGGKFDIPILLENGLSTTDKLDIKTERFVELDGSVIGLTVCDPDNRRNCIHFKDSCKILTGSLDKLTKEFDVEHKKLTGDLEHHLVTRENWMLQGEREDEYILNDGLGLLEMMIKFGKMVYDRFKVDVTKCFTAASLSKRIFFRRYYWPKSSPVYFQPEALDKRIRKGYMGGRNEVFRMGSVKGQVYYYDFTSSYPAEGRRGLPTGRPMITDFDTPKSGLDRKMFGFVECLARHKPDAIRRIKNRKALATHPMKIDSRTTFPILETWTKLSGVFTEELDYKMYDYQITSIVEYTKSTFMSRFFQDLFNSRQEAKKANNKALSYIFKIIINSGYGFWGLNARDRDSIIMGEHMDKEIYNLLDAGKLTSLNDNGRYTFARCERTMECKDYNVSVASAISSYARLKLQKFMQAILDVGGEVYYCDTDSVICNVNMEKHPALKAQFQPDGTGVCLGSTKNEANDLIKDKYGRDAMNELIEKEDGNIHFNKLVITGCKQYSIVKDLDDGRSVSINKLKGWKGGEMNGKKMTKISYKDHMAMVDGEFITQDSYQFLMPRENYISESTFCHSKIRAVSKKFRMIYTKGVVGENGWITPKIVSEDST